MPKTFEESVRDDARKKATYCVSSIRKIAEALDRELLPDETLDLPATGPQMYLAMIEQIVAHAHVFEVAIRAFYRGESIPVEPAPETNGAPPPAEAPKRTRKAKVEPEQAPAPATAAPAPATSAAPVVTGGGAGDSGTTTGPTSFVASGGAGGGGSAAPLVTPANDSPLPMHVSPQAAAVIKATGEEFRASEAKRIAREAEEEAAKKAAAAAPAAEPPKTVSKKPKAPRPEDIQLPWKTGYYAEKHLSSCTLAELEHILGQFEKMLVTAASDVAKRVSYEQWIERVVAWHAYQLDETIEAAKQPGTLQAMAVQYKMVHDAPGQLAAMRMHREKWIARIREFAPEAQS